MEKCNFTEDEVTEMYEFTKSFHENFPDGKKIDDYTHAQATLLVQGKLDMSNFCVVKTEHKNGTKKQTIGNIVCYNHEKRCKIRPFGAKRYNSNNKTDQTQELLDYLEKAYFNPLFLKSKEKESK